MFVMFGVVLSPPLFVVDVLEQSSVHAFSSTDAKLLYSSQNRQTISITQNDNRR